MAVGETDKGAQSVPTSTLLRLRAQRLHDSSNIALADAQRIGTRGSTSAQDYERAIARSRHLAHLSAVYEVGQALAELLEAQLEQVSRVLEEVTPPDLCAEVADDG